MYGTNRVSCNAFFANAGIIFDSFDKLQTMSIHRVIAKEASERMQQGWTLVDVRSVQEFEAGHPEGAYNVPFLHKTDQGMMPNEDFASVMEKLFSKDTALILSCRSGKRSMNAANALVELGYTNIVDLRGGFGGEKEASGAVLCQGWQGSGLPVAINAGERQYDKLKSK